MRSCAATYGKQNISSWRVWKKRCGVDPRSPLVYRVYTQGFPHCTQSSGYSFHFGHQRRSRHSATCIWKVITPLRKCGNSLFAIRRHSGPKAGSRMRMKYCTCVCGRVVVSFRGYEVIISPARTSNRRKLKEMQAESRKQTRPRHASRRNCTPHAEDCRS